MMFGLKLKTVFDFHKRFPDERSCVEFLESQRWGNKVVSPFDPNSVVRRYKDSWYCRKTKHRFSVKTRSFFEATKIPLKKWFLVIFLIENRKKISVVRVSEMIGVTRKTAWLMINKIKAAKGDYITPLKYGQK